MSEKNIKRNLVASVGAVLAGSMVLAGGLNAATAHFGMTQLQGGYMQVAANEGSCGGNKAKEGNCGGDKAMPVESKAKEGNCGADKANAMEVKKKEGSCGEAKCGANK